MFARIISSEGNVSRVGEKVLRLQGIGSDSLSPAYEGEGTGHTNRAVRVFAICFIAISLLLAWGSTPARGAVKPVDVDQALLKARQHLYAEQNKSGTWEEVERPEPNGDDGRADTSGRQWGGLTAIATYALLASGESPQEPRLASAIAFLKTADIHGIYAVGLRCQVWLLLKDDKTVKPLIQRDRELLLRALQQDTKNTKDNKFGFYSYYFDHGPKPADWYDHSVSQYGVLGMWALEQAGAEVPPKYWQVVDAAWRRAQQADGGWSYRQAGEGPSPEMESTSAAMTAAGVATLFISQDYLAADGGACKGNITNQNIEGGLAWMDKHASDALSSGNYYGLYGIERIGVASGRKYFSTIDWYQVGADAIVSQQRENGSWNDSIPDTCFAMLFLSRGRAPIAMNKLQYTQTDTKGKTVEGPWNQRPRDMANFARWAGRQIERDLNWQTVNLKVTAEELHDAPILYIAGNQELKLGEEQIAKLRTFVEQGGLILGNADCGSKVFATSFQKLGSAMFPAGLYKFRDLEPTHPIFSAEMFPATKGPVRTKLQGLSNGVRELMLLIPDSDLSRAWQTRAEKPRAEAYQTGTNIFLYATDKKGLRYKGDSYIVKSDPEIKSTRSVSLKRLQVGDNWNPEPGGWARLAALLHNEHKVDLDVQPAKLEASSLAGAAAVHFTGTATFHFTDAQRQVLQEFVKKGGTLIIDAAGGSALFADAAESELRAIWGDAANKGLARPLSPDNAVFHLPGGNIDRVRYRDFARSKVQNTRVPQLRAIEQVGRLAIFYSREDLSAGLVGQPVDGILGYDPQAATEIMRNLVLYASMEHKPPLQRQSDAK